ncbi:MAG: HPr-rel-A system PqqD family peptide chaperone [Gammaproteobacteria bacterium]
MEESTLSVWKVTALGSLHWLDWDGQHLVFDEASGDTHLMDEVGAAVFYCLQQSAGRDEIDLLHDVARLLDIPPDDQLLDQLQEILRRFAHSRLLERVAP